MSAYLLMAVGLVSRKLAERAVYFELILIFLGGVLGTGHHLYWAGGPSMWVPMGSMFSFIEVLPLVLLIIEAIKQYRLIRANGQFNYRLAYTYIIGAAFWNFVGAGVFGGGTLNAPLVNYYEHGTFLTLNHAHTALFGAFGLLAIGAAISPRTTCSVKFLEPTVIGRMPEQPTGTIAAIRTPRSDVRSTPTLRRPPGPSRLPARLRRESASCPPKPRRGR